MQNVALTREDIAPFVLESGRTPASPETLQWINDSRRVLWPRGDWKGIMDRIIVRPYNGTITLPYDVEMLSDLWPSSLAYPPDFYWFWPIPHNYETTPYVKGRKPSHMGMVIDLGDKFASFKDYLINKKPVNHRLSVVAESEDDEGVEITFHSVGENGNRVASTIKLGKAFEPVYTNDWIKYFRSVVKPVTVGRILVSIYDPNRGFADLCAVYEPDDINPNFRRYRVEYKDDRPFEVKVKRKYRKLVNENDMVEFPADALIHACNALTKRRGKDAQGYMQNINLAVEVLNCELAESEDRSGEHMRFGPPPVTNLTLW